MLLSKSITFVFAVFRALNEVYASFQPGGWGGGWGCQAGHVRYLVHVSNSEKQEGNYVAPD